MAHRVQAEVAFGADPQAGSGTYAWTDATTWVRAKDRIQIDHGRTDGYSTPPPSKLRLGVNNALGRWVARNATGPWYGLIRRNIPIRILCDADTWPIPVSATFGTAAASGWGVADTGQTWITTDAFGGTISATDWSVSSGSAKHSVPAASAYRISKIPLTTTDVDVKLTVTCPVPTGGNLEPANLTLRDTGTNNYFLRVQILTSAAVQVLITGRNGTLVAATTVPGLTHAAATPLNVRAQVYGSTIRMRVWQGAEPAAWHASVVDSDPIGDPGTSMSIRSGVASGNTNSKPVVFTYDNLVVTTPPVRFAGYIDELPVSWDPSVVDSTVAISASGFFRRLNQGDAPVRSAMYRTRTSADHNQPREYWPMEDPSGSTQFLNAISDGHPMTVTNQTPAASTAYVGSVALPTWGATLSPARASIRPFTATAYAVRFLLDAPANPASNAAIVQWRAGSYTWQVIVTTSGLMLLQAFDSASTERLGSGTIAFGANYLGKPNQIMVNVSQNGADIGWSLQIGYYNQDLTGATNTVSGTLASETIAMPFETKIHTVGGPLTGWTIGHLAFYDDTSASPFSGAPTGWIGNTATAHISGICRDARIPATVPVDAAGASITTLGPQSSKSIPGLLQEGASADGGILYEAGFAVGYTPRYLLYNQAVALTLDVEGLQVSDLHPTDDDQTVRNDVTVARSSGSSARATDEDHVDLYGRYDTSETFNFLDDSQLSDQAYWRLGLGTVDDMRFPGVEIDLVRNPSLRAAWQTVMEGSRVQVLNPPRELPPDVIDLLVQGWTETIDSGGNVWIASLNGTSYIPWIAWEIEGAGDLGKLSSGGHSTLTSGITAAATSISVTTDAGYPVWAAGATDTKLWCGGEVMRLTNVSGTGSTQTFTVTRAYNGVSKAHLAAESIDIYQPGVLTL